MASKADSGNSIRTASVVGATAGAIAIPVMIAPIVLAPQDARHRSRRGHRQRGPVDCTAPFPLLLCRFRDDCGQYAGHAKLRCMLEVVMAVGDVTLCGWRRATPF